MTSNDDTSERVATEWTSDTYRRGADDFEALPTDPHPSRDLGYELSDWERVTTDDSNRIVFFPERDEQFLQDSFVVVDESDLCDVTTRC